MLPQGNVEKVGPRSTCNYILTFLLQGLGAPKGLVKKVAEVVKKKKGTVDKAS